jgi:hypothetical protein
MSQEEHKCERCCGYHGIVNRVAAIDQLAAEYASRRSYFAPACGRRLIAMAALMDPVASALYIDGGAAIGEVMKVGPGAIGSVLPQLPQVLGDPVALSGVYVIPADTPLEKMQAAFPGAFTDGELPEQRVLMTVSPEEAEGNLLVPLAPIMLELVEAADPMMAIHMLDELGAEPEDDGLS